MIGKVYYSKYNRIRVVSEEDSRVYYTDMDANTCTFSNREQVEFDIIDESNSIVGNLRSVH